MKTLIVKKYFLDIRDREVFEREMLEKNPDLVETILEWDDEELVENLNSMKKNLV